MSTKLFAVLLLVVAMSVASAGPIVSSRPITPGNIVTQSPTDFTQFILGDDFILSQNTMIDTLTVWLAAGNTGTTNPAQELSAINLYLGNDPGPLNLVSSSYTFASAGILTGADRPLFAITFSGLNFAALGGTLYDFAVGGIPLGGQSQLALTSTPCGNLNGPCPGDGSDGIFLAFNGTPGSGPYNLFFTIPGSGTVGVADINVSVTSTTAAPEPSTFALLGLGFGALVYFRRTHA